MTTVPRVQERLAPAPFRVTAPPPWSVPSAADVERANASLDSGAAQRLLSRDDLAVRNQLRAVLSRDVAPRAAAIDEAGDFAGDSYQAVARAGLGGLIFPAPLGGQDAGTLSYALAVEEIAAACPATSLIYMTQMHAAYPILIAGTEQQKQQWIPRLCEGRAYGSLAVTEPNAGSDVSSLRTHATQTAEGFSLTGAKTFITTGDRADVIVVFATVDPAAGREGTTAFLVDGSAPGLTRGRPFRKLGMHGSTTAELALDGVHVSQDAVLGGVGGGWDLSMRSVGKSRISAAAQGIGIARASYSYAAAWLNAHDCMHEPAVTALASIYRRISQARLLLYATAAAADTDAPPSTTDIAVMKATCTDLGMDAALEAIDLLGGLGDLTALRAEQYARDARVTQIYDGTNEIQHLIIGRSVRAGTKGRS